MMKPVRSTKGKLERSVFNKHEAARVRKQKQMGVFRVDFENNG